MPCEPAAQIRPIASSARPAMSIAIVAGAAAGQDADDDQRETEEASPSQPTTKSAGAARPSMVKVEAPGRDAATAPSASVARPVDGSRSRSAGSGSGPGRAAARDPRRPGPGRRGRPAPGPAGSTLGDRVLGGGRPRGAALAGRRGPGRRADLGGRGRRAGRRRGRWRHAGRWSARGRPPRPPRDARSPCRTRRTATSPGRRAGCSWGRRG